MSSYDELDRLVHLTALTAVKRFRQRLNNVVRLYRKSPFLAVGIAVDATFYSKVLYNKLITLALNIANELAPNRKQFTGFMEDARNNIPPESTWVDSSTQRYINFSSYATNRLIDAMRALQSKGASAADTKSALADTIDKMSSSLYNSVAQQTRSLNSKAVGQIVKDRGYTRFTWADSRDDRVRHVHNAANDNEYLLSEGHPTEGLPGEPHGCRCRMTNLR